MAEIFSYRYLTRLPTQATADRRKEAEMAQKEEVSHSVMEEHFFPILLSASPKFELLIDYSRLRGFTGILNHFSSRVSTRKHRPRQLKAE